jgi:hypothetical protein
MDSNIIHCDNQSCVKLSENLVFHHKSKQIKIKYNYIRYMVQRKEIHEKVSNVFTKLLARTKVEYFHEGLLLVQNASLIEREC